MDHARWTFVLLPNTRQDTKDIKQHRMSEMERVMTSTDSILLIDIRFNLKIGNDCSLHSNSNKCESQPREFKWDKVKDNRHGKHSTRLSNKKKLFYMFYMQNLTSVAGELAAAARGSRCVICWWSVVFSRVWADGLVIDWDWDQIVGAEWRGFTGSRSLWENPVGLSFLHTSVAGVVIYDL